VSSQTLGLTTMDKHSLCMKRVVRRVLNGPESLGMAGNPLKKWVGVRSIRADTRALTRHGNRRGSRRGSTPKGREDKDQACLKRRQYQRDIPTSKLSYGGRLATYSEKNGTHHSGDYWKIGTKGEQNDI